MIRVEQDDSGFVVIGDKGALHMSEIELIELVRHPNIKSLLWRWQDTFFWNSPSLDDWKRGVEGWAKTAVK